MSDEGCICRGNWRAIVNECRSLVGRTFIAYDGVECRFFGPVDGEDDYYYGMHGADGTLRLLSCVGSIDGHGYTLKP